MDQKKLAKLLKAVIIIAALCLAVVYFFVIPTIGRDTVSQYPEFAGWYWPWQCFLWVTAAPLYAALIFSWKIASNIGNGNTFTEENSMLLKRIAWMAAVDSAYFLVGNIVLLGMNMSHPGVVLASLLIVLAGIAICVAAAVLSNLVKRAADLQDQYDLTI